jgi:hypothetical protein
MGDRKPGFLRKNFVVTSRCSEKPGCEGGVRKS